MAWVKRSVLGKGAYGTVYLAEPSDTTAPPIAVKSCFLSSSSSLQLEKRLLTRLRGCPGIVQCLGSALSVENGAAFYNLLLEYASGGTLADLILKGPSLRESEVRRYTGMILRGLCSVHAFDMFHCDLKPSNILVFPGGGGVNRDHLKIADFGLVQEAGNHNEDMDFWKFRFRGTPLYMSPESVARGEIGPPLDVWSLGCIVVEMLTGKPAWWQCPNLNTLMFWLAFLQKSPKIPEKLSEEGKDFLRKCFARNPSERWTAEMLLNHPFVLVLDEVSRPLYEATEPPTSPTGRLDFSASFLHRSLFYSDGLPPPGWCSFSSSDNSCQSPGSSASSTDSLHTSVSLLPPGWCSFSSESSPAGSSASSARTSPQLDWTEASSTKFFLGLSESSKYFIG